MLLKKNQRLSLIPTADVLKQRTVYLLYIIIIIETDFHKIQLRTLRPFFIYNKTVL